MDIKRTMNLKKLLVAGLVLVLAASLFGPLPVQAQVENGSWLVKTAMPTARTNFGSAVVGGEIYTVGGLNPANGQPMPVMEAYDPVSDTWSPRASLPVPLTDIAAAEGAGFLYAFGNFSGQFRIYEYWPIPNQWNLAFQNNNQRTGFAAVTGSDGNIYIFGGRNGAAMAQFVLRLNPNTNLLDTMGTHPPMVSVGAALGDDGKIYVVGDEFETNTFRQFDPATGTWTTMAQSLPVAKRFVKAASLNGKIYAVGGVSNNLVSTSVHEIDLTSASPAWVDQAGLAPAQGVNNSYVMGLVSTNGHLYALGPLYTEEYSIASDPPPPSGATVAAVPSQTDVFVGDPVSVALNVDASSLYGMQVTCAVDPAVLSLQSASFGGLFDPVDRLVGADSVDPIMGIYNGAISQAYPAGEITGSGTMATLSFTAAGPGSTTVQCTALLSDKDGFSLPHTYTGTTINVEAGTIVVNGVVNLQGRLDHSGVQITVFVGGVNTQSIPVDSTGAFSINLSTAGAYSLRAVYSPGYLSQCLDLDLAPGEVRSLPLTKMLGGELTGDEAIAINDATMLTANFGSVSGSPGFDPMVDINADGVINIQDLSILGGNYTFSGCQPW